MLIDLCNQHPLPPQLFDFARSTKADSVRDSRLPAIYCASPFLGRPIMVPNDVDVWLDSNILSHAKYERINLNISALIKWIESQQYGINPIIAYLEHHRTNHTVTAWDIAVNSATALQDKYGVFIDPLLLSSTSFQVMEMNEANHDYTDRLAHFVVIVRYIFSLNTTFERRCKMMAQCMSNALPYYRFMYLLGCLYFFIKENKKVFENTYPDESFFNKLQKDMRVGATVQDAWASAKNFASDVTFFTSTLRTPVSPITGSLKVPYIATSDAALTLILKELCYCRFELKDGTGHGTPIYRPGGIGARYVRSVVESNSRTLLQGSFPVPRDRWDREHRTLKKIAHDILHGCFDLRSHLKERGFR